MKCIRAGAGEEKANNVKAAVSSHSSEKKNIVSMAIEFFYLIAS